MYFKTLWSYTFLKLGSLCTLQLQLIMQAEISVWMCVCVFCLSAGIFQYA